MVVTLLTVNFCASALTVGLWVDKTYNFRVRSWVEYVECVHLLQLFCCACTPGKRRSICGLGMHTHC